jgi:hypothetical protein
VDSALAQRYGQTEVIVVDDGSTDDSPAIVDSYADRLRVIHKVNGGQASAMNVGFAASHGQVVIFLDADDLLLPEAAGTVAAAFATRPDLAKVEYPLAIMDADGQRTGQIIPPTHVPRLSGDMRRYELTAPFDMVWMGPSGTAYARGVLEQIMPIPQAYARGGADWYLAHVASLHGPVLFLGEVGACYRIHSANAFAGHNLDLHRVAHTVEIMRLTVASIEAEARRLGLSPPGGWRGGILSFTYLAHRLILARLGAHSAAEPPEARLHLVRLGLVALARRQDVCLTLKVAMELWLVATAIAPRLWAKRLARSMLFSEERPGYVNRLLGVVHLWHTYQRRRAARDRPEGGAMVFARGVGRA